MQGWRVRRGRLIPTHAGKTPSRPSRTSPTRAHPHSRGENATALAMSSRTPGSSPLTRGKRGTTTSSPRACGLIPTHAGKTQVHADDRDVAGAHPHSRGENAGVTMHALRHRGSSPLTRGKRDGDGAGPPARRLIPTHAGKTHGSRSALGGQWAHPHSRGENNQPRSCAVLPGGSSPLTRGKPTAVKCPVFAQGLIPTHAGKTRTATALATTGTAHPHSRGENAGGTSTPALISGSSPLTRGKREMKMRLSEHEGLIPTHAGKTCRGSPRRSRFWAHPHSRGENSSVSPSPEILPGSSPLTRGKRKLRPGAARQSGSSPLTRGKRQSPSQTLPSLGLIPTHAGKTHAGARDRDAPRAHPHSRGENIPVRGRAPLPRGSSPLTRGKHLRGPLSE